MGQATYRVHIPATDTLGLPLHAQVPAAAHQWLHESQPRLFHDIWVEGPHQHGHGPAHHLVTLAEDTPETDGYIKQLASHVGEIANHPFVVASKHGENGVQSWTMPNRHYVEGVNSDYAQAPVLPLQGEGWLQTPRGGDPSWGRDPALQAAGQTAPEA